MKRETIRENLRLRRIFGSGSWWKVKAKTPGRYKRWKASRKPRRKEQIEES